MSRKPLSLELDPRFTMAAIRFACDWLIIKGRPISPNRKERTHRPVATSGPALVKNLYFAGSSLRIEDASSDESMGFSLFKGLELVSYDIEATRISSLSCVSTSKRI